jgi:hypothetical protein
VAGVFDLGDVFLWGQTKKIKIGRGAQSVQESQEIFEDALTRPRFDENASTSRVWRPGMLSSKLLVVGIQSPEGKLKRGKRLTLEERRVIMSLLQSYSLAIHGGESWRPWQTLLAVGASDAPLTSLVGRGSHGPAGVTAVTSEPLRRLVTRRWPPLL